MLIVTVRRSWRRPESVEDQFSANVRRVVQVSEHDLVARGIVVDLLQMAKRIGPSAKPPNTKICPGRKVSPWTVSLTIIEGAIEPRSNDTEELSMKAPMSVSKPADLG